MPFVVTISPAICDCTMLTWNVPAPQSLTTTVLVEPSPTLTINHATANAASKTAHPAIRMCYSGAPNVPCSEVTTLTSVVNKGQSSLPVFMTRNVDVLTIAATTNTQALTYILSVVMSTPNSGNVNWDTITITVGVCVIASIDMPTNPGVVEYIMFYPVKNLSLTPNFTQRPACGYTLTETLTWTIPGGAPITVDSANKYHISAVSTDPTKHNTYSLIFKDFISYGTQTFQPQVTFDFKVTDPCRTSVITPITLTTPWEMVLGTIVQQSFTEAPDSAATAHGTATICGPRLYQVLDATNTASVLVNVSDLGSGNYKLIATSSDELYEGNQSLTFRVTFANYPLTANAAYPKADTPFVLKVIPATCDCSLITWDNPPM